MPSGESVGNLFAFFGLDVGALERDVDRAEKELNTLDKKMKRIGEGAVRTGKQMTKMITLPVAAAAAASIRAAGNFEKSMTESLAIVDGVSQDTRKEMEKLAVQMSTETTFSAKEAADAYFFLASSGMDAQQSMAALPQIMKFAQAGAFDLSTATDLATDAQTALGMRSEEAEENLRQLTRTTDVLVKANTLANATTEQFSRALTNKAAAALKVTNKEIEEGVAVLGAYADAGVKGEKAGQALAIVLRDLQRAALEEEEAFERFGIEVFDAEGNMNKMADILQQVEGLFADLSVEQRKASLTTLGFQERSQLFLLTILGMSEEIRNYEKELKKAGGTTEKVADKQLEAFNNQAKRLWNNFVALGIEFGENLIPMLESLSEKLGVIVDWFRELDETTQNWIIGLAAAAAAMGPILLIGGKILVMAAQMSTAITLLTAQYGSLGAAMAAAGNMAVVAWVKILGPLGLAAAGIAFAVRGIKEEIEKIEKDVDETGRMLQKFEDNNKRIQAAKQALAKGDEDALRNAFAAAEKDTLEAKQRELALLKEQLSNEAARFARNEELLKNARMMGQDIRRNNERRRKSVELMRELRSRISGLSEEISQQAEAEAKRTEEMRQQKQLAEAQASISEALYQSRTRAEAAGDRFMSKQLTAIKQFEDELDALHELKKTMAVDDDSEAAKAIDAAMGEAERLKDERLRLIEEERKQDLQSYAATERQKRIIALREERDKMLAIARTQEERSAVLKAFEQKREQALKSMVEGLALNTAGQEVGVVHRLEAIEKGTVEAFRAEKGLDETDPTDQAIMGTEENTRKSAAFQREMVEVGIPIRDLNEVSM